MNILPTGGIAGSVVGFMSEYYTSSKFSPVKGMAKKSMMGPAITVTDGLAVGMKSCAIPVIVLGVPARYIHTHNAVLDLADLHACVDLAVALTRKLDAKTVAGLTRYV